VGANDLVPHGQLTAVADAVAQTTLHRVAQATLEHRDADGELLGDLELPFARCAFNLLFVGQLVLAVRQANALREVDLLFGLKGAGDLQHLSRRGLGDVGQVVLNELGERHLRHRRSALGLPRRPLDGLGAGVGRGVIAPASNRQAFFSTASVVVEHRTEAAFFHVAVDAGGVGRLLNGEATKRLHVTQGGVPFAAQRLLQQLLEVAEGRPLRHDGVGMAVDDLRVTKVLASDQRGFGVVDWGVFVIRHDQPTFLSSPVSISTERRPSICI